MPDYRTLDYENLRIILRDRLSKSISLILQKGNGEYDRKYTRVTSHTH